MYRIGIDIGGTQLRIALIDADYKIVEVYKTANDRAQDAKANCAPLVDWIRAKQDAGYEFAGIGIGSPGPLDLRCGQGAQPAQPRGLGQLRDRAVLHRGHGPQHLPQQ